MNNDELTKDALFKLRQKQAKEFEIFGQQMYQELHNSFLSLQKKIIKTGLENNNEIKDFYKEIFEVKDSEEKKSCECQEQINTQLELINSLKARIEELETDSFVKVQEIVKLQQETSDLRGYIQSIYDNIDKSTGRDQFDGYRFGRRYGRRRKEFYNNNDRFLENSSSKHDIKTTTNNNNDDATPELSEQLNMDSYTDYYEEMFENNEIEENSFDFEDKEYSVSSLGNARVIDDLNSVSYPPHIKPPNPELNSNSEPGKFKYDRNFLMQFKSICKERPENLPFIYVDEPYSKEGRSRENSLGSKVGENILYGRSRENSLGSKVGENILYGRSRENSLGSKEGRSRQNSLGNRSGRSRENSLGNRDSENSPSNKDGRSRENSLDNKDGENSLDGRSRENGPSTKDGRSRENSLGNKDGRSRENSLSNKDGRSRENSLGQSQDTPITELKFSPMTSEERNFLASSMNMRNETSSPTTTTSSSSPPPPKNLSSRRRERKKSKQEVTPLERSENRWIPEDAEETETEIFIPIEIVKREAQSLLDKLTLERFDSISDQIIEYANKSRNEEDGRILREVIRLVFEKSCENSDSCTIYARLCRKVMENVDPEIVDENIKNTEGKVIKGGVLFRKYLLNRCQETFEKSWKSNEKEPVLTFNEAVKSKRQGLGLLHFIGELFKVNMVTERIMHECIKKLMIDPPEEEEISSLCAIMNSVGEQLDDRGTSKTLMDYYFDRMEDMMKFPDLSSRIKTMIKDTIDLRNRSWKSFDPPKVIEQSRNDGWNTVQRNKDKVGDLSKFGSVARSKITTNISLAPGGVLSGGSKGFSKSDNKQTNMFNVLAKRKI